jgi:NAD(P)-dependent dehydrogenase (short-subunit alcohol dehydrogenase family)
MRTPGSAPRRAPSRTFVAVGHAASVAGRASSALDVASAALLLPSAEAGYVNGVCLPVDSRLSLRAV